MKLSTLLAFFFIVNRSIALNYCIPNPTNGINGYTISDITLESLDASGGPTPFTYYLDSANTLTCYLNPGYSYNLILKTGPGHSTSTCAAWIDWNNDTTFSNSSEKLGEFVTSSANTTDTITFTVPLSSEKGKLRLRIRCSSSTVINSCNNYSSGQTTDFSITVLNPDYDHNFYAGWEYASTGTSFIDGVHFYTLTNLSSGSDHGPVYHDYSSMSTNVGSCISINIDITTVALTSLNNRIEVYVDVNDDGSFELTNELFATLFPATGTHVSTSSISLPNVTGDRRMRVYFYDDNGLSEIEDYTLNISPAGATGTPQAFIGSDLFSICTTTCDYQACAGQVHFFDYSCGNPTSWMWVVPGANPDTSYSRNPTFTVSAGTYTVMFVATNASGSDTDYTNIDVQAPISNFSLGHDTSLCSGNGLTLSAPHAITPSDCYLYQWSTGEITPDIHTNSSGNFSVRVDRCDHSGCPAFDAINISFSPLVYAMSGGGYFCTGTPAPSIGLANSETGISYQLKLDGNNVGIPKVGTGSSLSFGTQSSSGTYTIIATSSVTSCTASMTGNIFVTENPLPSIYHVTGGGTFCASSGGAPIGLDSSEVNFEYQMLRNGSPTGAPLSGTGGILNFPNQTVAGTYTVVASDPNTTCADTMIGTAIINTLPAPALYNVVGGGSYCGGTTGSSVGISDSENGVLYLLFLDSVSTGDTLTGSGSPMNFTQLTQSGVYTIIASNGTACFTTMNGNASLTIKPAPVLFNVSTGGTYCIGGGSVPIDIDSSQSGINYRLWVNGLPSGGIVAGNDSALNIGNITTPGTYYVVGTNTANACTATMNDSAVILIDSFPHAYNVTGGGQICSGDSGVNISLSHSDTSVSYELYLNGVQTGTVFQGTGGVLSFGLIDDAGLYRIWATGATTCFALMKDSAVIGVDPIPSVSITSTIPDSICIYAAPIPLAGTPSGGIFSGPGIMHDTLFPGFLSGPGTTHILFEYSDPNTGCSNSAMDSMGVELCIGIDELISENDFNIYPNPADKEFVIEITLKKNTSISFDIVDIAGKTIQHSSVKNVNGKHSLRMDTSKLIDGIYFVKMNLNDEVVARKIVVAHGE